jgi:hypothetical protein
VDCCKGPSQKFCLYRQQRQDIGTEHNNYEGNILVQARAPPSPDRETSNATGARRDTPIAIVANYGLQFLATTTALTLSRC